MAVTGRRLRGVCSHTMSDPQPRGAIAPSATAPFDVPVTPRNPGMPLELDWVEEVRVNRSAVERRAATLADPADGQEGVAGRLAAPRGHPDGPHDPGGRRHAGPGAPALRQGAPAGARATCWRRWARPSCRSGSARCACTTPSSRPRSRRSKARGFRWRPCPPDFPAGLSPFAQRIGRDPRVGGGGRGGDRRRDHPGPRAHGELARALRRGARHARGLRRRPHQDDPRHRRAGHAAHGGAAPAWCA